MVSMLADQGLAKDFVDLSLQDQQQGAEPSNSDNRLESEYDVIDHSEVGLLQQICSDLHSLLQQWTLTASVGRI